MGSRKKLPKFPHQFIYFSGLRVRKMLTGMASRLVPNPQLMYEKVQTYWLSHAIYAACKLDLADILAKGPKSITELSTVTASNEEHLYRLMRALASEGIFKEGKGKIFRNTRLSEALREGENSVKYLVLHQLSPTVSSLLSQLPETVRNGEDAASRLLGTGVFQHMEENPEKNAIYQKGMDQSSSMMAMALLSAYNFNGVRRIMDMGGGHGMLLACILESHPKMQGTLFDQPHVVAESPEALSRFSLGERLEVVSGDFFQDIPKGGDIYLMKNILHAFSDEESVELLKKVGEAMASGGKVLILETVIGPGNDPSLGKLLDLLMMSGTRGGKERTGQEFTEIVERAGMKVSRIVPTVAPFSIIEAGPAT